MSKRNTWAERRPIPHCELGVLHAFGPGSLHAPNHVLEFKGSGERRLRVPLRGLRLVCLYGPVRVTAGAIRLVTDAAAALAYFSANGMRTNGILQPATDSWKGRRYRQFQAVHDRPWMLEQARALVLEKLASMATALEHIRRHGRGSGKAAGLLRDLPAVCRNVETAPNHAVLRGNEGIASKRWFEVLGDVLPEGWTLPGRRKRPPTDPVNALLSLGYTLLFHRVQAACTAWGLDSALGVLHEYRPGRASLACDLMEPFRVPAIDRLLLKSLSYKRFQPADFVRNEADLSVRLTEDAWKRWLADLETHLHTASEAQPSLQVVIVERVRKLADSLPDRADNWPGTSESDEPSEDFADLPSAPMPESTGDM